MGTLIAITAASLAVVLAAYVWATIIDRKDHHDDSPPNRERQQRPRSRRRSSKDPRTGMTKSDLDWNVRLLRHKDGLAMPKAFAETTQSCIQRHTSESGEWKTDGAKQENDILYSPGAKGSGIWAIKYKDRALRKILAGLRVTPEQFATIVEETNKTLGR